jgi:enterochelin esterase-like enzyme
VCLETVRSDLRQRDVDLFTAVPTGHGDGAGLPVVVVLHGASATAADFQPYGLSRFLTAAVEDGAPPFVPAGADGGVLRWEPDPSSDDDQQRLIIDEMPQWLADRGFDADARPLWGWSMGGYGCLRLAEVEPGWARAVAAFSPALSVGERVFTDADKLDVPLNLCAGPTTRSTRPSVRSRPKWSRSG